jgi:hypothetical protein
MTIRQGLYGALLAALAAGLGCSGSSRPDPRRAAPPSEQPPQPKTSQPAPATQGPRPPVKQAPTPPDNLTFIALDGPKDEGVLRGQVRWRGPVPTVEEGATYIVRNRRSVRVTPTPPVQVDPTTGGLANAVVYLKKAPPQAEPYNPDLATLTQSKGRYEPHVQVVARGSKLRLRASDDTADFHLSGEASAYKALARGRSVLLPLRNLGLVLVTSDDRPWMTPAYVFVLDHDYHAVTGEDGRFRLPKLRPGKYELVLWHEGWAGRATEGVPAPIERTLTVELAPGRGAEVNWTLP